MEANKLDISWAGSCAFIDVKNVAELSISDIEQVAFFCNNGIQWTTNLLVTYKTLKLLDNIKMDFLDNSPLLHSEDYIDLNCYGYLYIVIMTNIFKILLVAVFRFLRVILLQITISLTSLH
ncbi:uncharacterized protein EV154DRAFT_476447 [Mucor mucedo]|uniref:uncharacterized protein n=1 Tax=Mucor mucedo TaxID=29922 RepID=UPI00221E3C96|nr:uncharacterized protein EV154DRAFT_476447 [Mucor mucedo]KAI7896433.1 hypothetical protein EV154DRAFT_476447 [Mucor mucedo]